MQKHPTSPSSNRTGRILRWSERLLVLAGAAMLVWCAWVVADAKLFQAAARRSLEPTVQAETVETIVVPRPPNPVRESPLTPTPLVTGSAVAALSIPRVQLSAVVLHGSDSRTLRRGPGHLENTPLPGESGNVVIAGHRDTFFLPLRHVRVGDDVFADTPKGRVHYRVSSLQVVDPHDVSVLEPTDEAVLTLITCYPFWALGPAPDRLIVRATRVGDPMKASLGISSIPRQEATPAEVVQEPAAKQSRASSTGLALDDDHRVRDAVENFRLTYNARLISRNDVRSGGPLRFRACDVFVTGDHAAAICETLSQLPDDGEREAWTVSLERVDEGWTIKSIAVD